MKLWDGTHVNYLLIIIMSKLLISYEQLNSFHNYFLCIMPNNAYLRIFSLTKHTYGRLLIFCPSKAHMKKTSSDWSNGTCFSKHLHLEL